jgi:hypothetical protein
LLCNFIIQQSPHLSLSFSLFKIIQLSKNDAKNDGILLLWESSLGGI